jgi:CRP/FNR family cyclic AMP-dependent transcriptional regulator
MSIVKPSANSPNTPNAPAGPLSAIPLFALLSVEEQTELLGKMTTEHYDENQTIFWLGDKGESLFLVRNGRVSITVPNDAGEHVVLDELGPGGFFGEISLLDGGPRTATIRAAVPTDVYRLGRDDFHAFVRSRPDAAIDILTVMGHRQRASTEVVRGLKNPNLAFDQSHTTLWQRASDIIAAVAASPWFTSFHFIWFGTWILTNLLADKESKFAFDPFPFGLLTMVVSLEAIFLAIFVMVSQNRQSQKDRLHIDLDYQINVKAQTEIIKIARRLERMENVLLKNADEAPQNKESSH